MAKIFLADLRTAYGLGFIHQKDEGLDRFCIFMANEVLTAKRTKASNDNPTTSTATSLINKGFIIWHTEHHVHIACTYAQWTIPSPPDSPSCPPRKPISAHDHDLVKF